MYRLLTWIKLRLLVVHMQVLGTTQIEQISAFVLTGASTHAVTAFCIRLIDLADGKCSVARARSHAWTTVVCSRLRDSISLLLYVYKP